MSDFLYTSIASLGIELTDTQQDKLNLFYKLLVEWNEKMNLTAITEYNDVVIKHFMDSIAINQAFDISEDSSVIDVGTGAGFPGIPLNIVYPAKYTLLDSLNKRINFLNEVISQCDLKNINTIHSRAEDGAHNKDLREKFDIAVSRAVANLSTLTEYCLPYVKIGGRFISYKSGNIDVELEQSKKAISILGGEIEKVVPVTLPTTDIERTFVIIKKVKQTGSKYPRKAGLPSKEPLS